MNRSTTVCLCLCALALAPQVAVADESASHRIYAKPVVRTAPKYPPSELRNRQQGWVELNYVVTESGEVVEPVVEASSGSRAFERAALNTVTRWSYEPAMLNGEPIQQCKTAVRISFAIDGAQMGVSKNFRRRYRKMDKAIDRGDIDFASSELERAFQLKGLTLGEQSWLWALRARIEGVREDREQQLFAVRRALRFSKGWIPEQLRIGLLTTQFVLEIARDNHSAAMSAYLALKAIDGADTSELDPIADKLMAIVESDQSIYKAAKIGGDQSCETCASQWKYKPLRRAVEITDIDGELGNLELRCEWQRFIDTAREGVAWEIPDSWGKCSVVVYGETGSTFKLVELPAS